MKYIVKVIGVRLEFAKLFYISDSLQNWLTTRRADAATYCSIAAARSAISQGIENIKRELGYYELEGIQIVGEVITENVIQILKPSDI